MATNPAPSDPASLTIRDETTLASHERSSLGNKPTLDNFAHFARFSTDRTQLFFAKVYRGREFLGLAPITKLVKHRSTDLLRPDRRKWMAPLFGPLARRTTYLIDSSFLAFEYANPFFCADERHEATVRTAVSDHLKQKQDVDTIWLAEPRRDTTWAEQHGYDCFSILPMVHVNLVGHTTVESFVAALSKKRRKNWRADRRVFDERGGAFEHYRAPIPVDVLEEMHACLLLSASHNDLCVPFEDLQNSKAAFFGQDQRTIVARVAGKVVGFFSFLSNGVAMQQCHGGFDYRVSQDVKAYANLINAAIEHAIAHGFQWLTMGPLNNETKRRAATHLMPVMTSLWCRDAIIRFLMRKFFLENLQVYVGDA